MRTGILFRHAGVGLGHLRNHAGLGLIGRVFRAVPRSGGLVAGACGGGVVGGFGGAALGSGFFGGFGRSGALRSIVGLGGALRGVAGLGRALRGAAGRAVGGVAVQEVTVLVGGFVASAAVGRAGLGRALRGLAAGLGGAGGPDGGFAGLGVNEDDFNIFGNGFVLQFQLLFLAVEFNGFKVRVVVEGAFFNLLDRLRDPDRADVPAKEQRIGNGVFVHGLDVVADDHEAFNVRRGRRDIDLLRRKSRKDAGQKENQH